MLRMLLILLICLKLSVAASPVATCETDEFQCSNGICLAIDWKCDGSPDCSDNSDEADCPKVTCSENFFRCSDGACIPNRWLCDESADCDEHEDEDPLRCQNKTCSGYHCKGSNHCIPHSWVCDGKEDCDGGDDENRAQCALSNKCSDSEFQCADKKCIQMNWKCDGHEDCTDGSDEANCDPTGCDADEFKCNDGKCIMGRWRCDGDSDCKDGSDEEECVTGNHTCDANAFQCTLPLNDPQCIPAGWRCDGDPDCKDESDEENCDGVRTCEPEEKMCVKNHYCVKKEFFCDGQEDCQDGSDEWNCNNTTTAKPLCESNQFDCFGDGSRCISDKYKCDGNNDCDNFADEKECPISNICSKDNGGCHQICSASLESSTGRVCECYKGYKLKPNSDTTCEDINECDVVGICSQICINRKGSYKCECGEGYILTDHRYCKSKSEHQPELIMSDNNDIRRYELSTYHYSLLLDDKVSGALAVDFDFRKGMVYWVGIEHEGVESANLHTKVHQSLKNYDDDEVKAPDGLAVDWVHGNLYVSDTGRDQIVVSRLDGSNVKVLLSNDLQEPRALAVDPYHGWMYWSDWGMDPKIEKCGMNGKGRKAIVTQDIVWPNGLTIDYIDNRLYWVDAKLHHIASTDLDGNNYRLVVHGHKHLGHPYGITLFEDFIYWTDWMDNAVHKTSKFGNGNVSTIALNLKMPFDVKVFHQSRQPSKVNHCGSDYGGCSHLCLPKPGDATETQNKKRYECACPTGMELDTDYQNCVQSKEIVTPKPVKPVNPNDKSGDANRPHKNRTPITSSTTSTTTTTTSTASSSSHKSPTMKPSTGSSNVEPVVTIHYGEPTQSPHSGPGKHRSLNDTESQPEGTKSVGHVAGVAVAVILGVGVIVGVVAFILVRRYKKKNVKSMNFDNPVYRKTTTDDQLMIDKEVSNTRLERESMQPLNQEPMIV